MQATVIYNDIIHTWLGNVSYVGFMLSEYESIELYVTETIGVDVRSASPEV